MESILLYICIYIVEALILWQYCVRMFHTKHSSLTTFVFSIIVYIIPFIVVFQDNFWLNTLLFACANFVYIFAFFKTRWHSSLIHAVITTITMTASELLIVGLISDIVYNVYGESNIFNLTVLAVLSKALYFCVLRIISAVFGHTKGTKQIYNFSISILILVPIMSLIIAHVLLTLSVNTVLTSSQDRLLALSAVLLILINIVIFCIYNYNQKKSNELAELQIQYQKEYDSAEYYRMLIEQHENQSILIHDIKKHLNSIALINQEGNQEAVATYINQIISSPDLRDSVRVSDNQLLNAILSRYIRLCQNENIDFRPDIRKGCLDFVQDTDMTTLICNLLDNAVESAVRYEENPYIELHISKKEKTSFTLLTMINSCRTNPFTPGTGALVTHKKDKQRHGFGIKSIKRIIRKYDGDIEMYHSSETSTFHTIITLKNLPQ